MESLKSTSQQTKVKNSDIMDISEENKKLLETLNPIWFTSAQASAEVAIETFDLSVNGLELSWDLVQEEWLNFVDEFGLEKAKVINETTRKELKEIVRQGIEDGLSNQQIRNEITDRFSFYKSTRATLIARTETHMASVGGTFATYEAAGIRQKEWLTTIDGRERASHETMTGQIRKIDMPFTSGAGNLLMFPGDPSAPPGETIQCRCALLPVI